MKVVRKKNKKSDGKSLENKIKEEYEGYGCIVYMVKRGRYYNPYTDRWMNYGEDLFGAFDGIAICQSNRSDEQREKCADGIYFIQSTTYNESSSHKKRIEHLGDIDYPIHIDLRLWSKVDGKRGWQSQRLEYSGGSWKKVWDQITNANAEKEE